MILQVAMTTRARRCVGVELARSRHEGAVEALDRVRAQGLITAGECSFLHEDLMEVDLADATVIYTCSTAFSDRLMGRLMKRLSGLRPGLCFVTTRQPMVRYKFTLESELRLDMSWHRRSPVYIYRLGA